MKLLVLLIAITLVVITVLAGLWRRESALADGLVQRLQHTPLPPVDNASNDNTPTELPAPVARYFRHVLDETQAPICVAELEQEGTLRTDGAGENWMPFTAKETVVPGRGFIWDARIAIPLGTHIRVFDSFIEGRGSGRVSLLSAIPVARSQDDPRLNAGALHRYLAEAVWFPTALRPQAGVRWSAIDGNRALAEVAIGGVSVSLEFRFNTRDEIEAVYSPARWGTFGGGYEQRRWEGHFRSYEAVQGIRVPQYGEVGWYSGDELRLVWKGTITSARYDYCGQD